METFLYFTTEEITYDNIEKCLGDKYMIGSSDSESDKNPPMFVFYDVTYNNDSSVEIYTRWTSGDMGYYDAEFPEIAGKIKSVFLVDFRVYQLGKLIPILADVLECLGGYFQYNGKDYKRSNLHEFSEIELEA